MTKNQTNKQVGDTRSPQLQPSESGLRSGVDQADQLLANGVAAAEENSPIKNLAAGLKAAQARKGTPSSCKQILWLSFFFDGTGNNLEADIELLKHSNVARLFRAHAPKSDDTLTVYIPGVGTYFPEIGDDGGSAFGKAFGAKGQERLKFSLGQFDEFLKKPLALANAPANAIQEINVAVFGFSRGAALARAFINLIMEERCDLRGQKWILRKGAWPVRFRFLGLFDTVGSVGLPMSSNTTGTKEGLLGDTAGMIKKRLRNYENTRPEKLAFFKDGSAGADPAPGSSNGHDEWGARLRIHETVEEVRHFVAAHEIRNSFPVDSVSILLNGRISKPANFFETLYPGAHSDVGGGYAPGEGAKGTRPSDKLALIPLRHMYDFAVQRGVPMLSKWTARNEEDFNIAPTLRDTFDLYSRAIGSFSHLGKGINKHMELYYAWRFRAIRRKAAGDKTEATLIEAHDSKFKKHNAEISREVENLTVKENVANVSWNSLKAAQEMKADDSEGNVLAKANIVSDADIQQAREKFESSHAERLKAQARKDSIPDMKNLQTILGMYDKQLMADVHVIRDAIRNSSRAVSGATMKNLRPHYRVLLEAYENEFVRNNGLKDEKIISFFDNYVHDSLAGFAKDATLPSDPRVVYLGGDEKYRYAGLHDETLLESGDTRIA